MKVVLSEDPYETTSKDDVLLIVKEKKKKKLNPYKALKNFNYLCKRHVPYVAFEILMSQY